MFALCSSANLTLDICSDKSKHLLLQNLDQVALNLSPILHRGVPLAVRAELGVSGFVMLDIMKMVADELNDTLRLPTGSSFLAPQTMCNLQSTSLVGILICISKDETWSPWQHGHSRLSELSIEEHFAYLRQQSPNAQLSARAFWKAACRVSLRASKTLNAQKDVVNQGEKPLTQKEFLASSCHVF